MNDSKFNKAFSAFIIIGMTVAVILTTAIKLGAAADGRFLLLISALGALMGVLSTVCSANGLIITFLFGLIDVAIYGAVCFVSGKYGNAVLHFLYFIPMQFVGWYQWRKRGAGKGSEVKPRILTSRQWALGSLVFLVGSVAAYLILARFDKSSADTFLKTAVILDVLPLMCNIFGQFLMSTAYKEQWLFWIGVNITSIAMWATSMKGASDSYALIYMIKYFFYLINSLNGYRIWHNLSRKA